MIGVFILSSKVYKYHIDMVLENVTTIERMNAERHGFKGQVIY